MSDSVLHGRHEPRERCSKPLNEGVWRAWLEKNRLEETRNSVARTKAVKWFCIAVLIAAAALSSHIASYQGGVRFIVALGAVIVMCQGFRTHRYYFAALFAAMIVFYNPLFPTFTLSGDWERLIVLASVIPFIASLVWMSATDLTPRPSAPATA